MPIQSRNFIISGLNMCISTLSIVIVRCRGLVALYIPNICFQYQIYRVLHFTIKMTFSHEQYLTASNDTLLTLLDKHIN